MAPSHRHSPCSRAASLHLVGSSISIRLGREKAATFCWAMLNKQPGATVKCTLPSECGLAHKNGQADRPVFIPGLPWKVTDTHSPKREASKMNSTLTPAGEASDCTFPGAKGHLIPLASWTNPFNSEYSHVK